MEDASYAFTITPFDPALSPIEILLGCDGVAGNNGGDVAAQRALRHIAMVLSARFLAILTSDASSTPPLDDHLQILRDAIQSANEHVLKVANGTSGLKGMACTIVCAVIVAGNLVVGHLGDSRCYLYRRGRLHCLTEDHTITGELMRAGVLRPECARHHPSAHTITRFLGDPKGVNVDARSFALEQQDVVLLTTDGCTDVLSDAAIADSVRDALEGRTKFRTLSKRLAIRALRMGTTDNVTVVAYAHGPAVPSRLCRNAPGLTAAAPRYPVEALHMIKENGNV
jgi:protein phosphatase